MAVVAARLARRAWLTLWCVYFFRDPPRVTPLRDGLVIAPADGRVSRVINAVPPAELALGDKPVPRISIFMSVFDCHVNRSPVTGRIERMAYRPGALRQCRSRQGERGQRAQLPRDRDRRPAPRSASCRSPAWWRGASCRSCKQGTSVGAGERIGMIRFGSRVDVYLPEGVRPLAAEGQTAIAGETIIADLRGGDQGRSYRVG